MYVEPKNELIWRIPKQMQTWYLCSEVCMPPWFWFAISDHKTSFIISIWHHARVMFTLSSIFWKTRLLSTQGIAVRKTFQRRWIGVFYRDVSTQPISLSNLLYSGISMGAQVWMMLCGTISRLFRFVHKCDINIWLVMWCGKSCVRKNQSWSEGYYIAIVAIMRTGVKEKIALLHR